MIKLHPTVQKNRYARERKKGVISIQYCSLASSSSGNCHFIRSGKTRLLVDAGCSARYLCGALEQIGEDMQAVSAVLITHEHRDHVQGLAVLARKYPFLIGLHPATYARLAPQLKDIPLERLRFLQKGTFFCDDLQVEAFHLSHDAANTFGYTFSDGRASVGIATDLGCTDREVFTRLAGCRLVAVDSNHDPDMLQNGAYPAYLKARIFSDTGHLSNASAGELLAQLAREGLLEQAVLAHLSPENNTPCLALGTVQRIFNRYGIRTGTDVVLETARRQHISAFHNLS